MNDYRQVDDRDTNHSNCTKCGIIVEFAYITTGESLCESCYLKVVDKRSVELEDRKKEVGLIRTTNFTDYTHTIKVVDHSEDGKI